jgi:catalase
VSTPKGKVGRYQIRRTQDDYTQVGERYRSIDDRERDDLVNNLVDALKQCDRNIQLRMVWHFINADENYGTRVANGIGVDVEEARKLPPLPGKPPPGQPRSNGDAAKGDATKGDGAPNGQKAAEAAREPARSV